MSGRLDASGRHPLPPGGSRLAGEDHSERGRSKPLQLTVERAPFVMLPRWLLYHPEVGEGAKFLYCVLHDLVAGREGPTRPVTRAKLAELCRVSANTVDRRLGELIAAGAVDKEPQILAGGQVANVYMVWLTPPDQRHDRINPNGKPRSERIPTDGNPVASDAIPVDKRVPTDEEARSERIPTDGDRSRRWGPPLPRGGEPTVLKEQDQEFPPNPRRAGELTRISKNNDGDVGEAFVDRVPHADAAARPVGGRRAEGTSLRALGANPRARETAERSARLEAALEAKTAVRLAAERAGEAGRVAFEAEALAVSAAFDDDQLVAVVDAVRDLLVGPLAQSALPVTRAVVDWCRQASVDHPGSGSLAGAVGAALATGQCLPGVPPLPLALPAAPAGTVPLRRRVAAVIANRVEEAS
jgi:hypothetical protein